MSENSSASPSPGPGSAADAADVAAAVSRPRSLARRLKRFLRRLVSRPLLAIACAVVPRLFMAYMWFVWKTSRVVDCGLGRGPTLIREHDGLVAMLWHEEVFSVAWAYKHIRPHTLASVGDAGEVIARMLELCGFVVFRGGSSHRESRRRGEILAEMIAHMKSTPNVCYGITVDGSHGPYHHIKRGALVIARECRKPIALVRSWARHNIYLPTWDRMAMPLPFNRIHQYLRGPFFLPANAYDPEVFEAFRARMERELDDLAEQAYRELRGSRPRRPHRPRRAPAPEPPQEAAFSPSLAGKSEPCCGPASAGISTS